MEPMICCVACWLQICDPYDKHPSRSVKPGMCGDHENGLFKYCCSSSYGEVCTSIQPINIFAMKDTMSELGNYPMKKQHNIHQPLQRVDLSLNTVEFEQC